MSVKQQIEMSPSMEESWGLLWTEAAAGAFLNLSNRTLQAWRVRGCGPKFIKVGRSVRYRIEDLQEFVKRNVHQSTSG